MSDPNANDMDTIDFPTKVKKRYTASMSQAAFAEAIGSRPHNISVIEKGEMAYPTFRIIPIIAALGITNTDEMMEFFQSYADTYACKNWLNELTKGADHLIDFIIAWKAISGEKAEVISNALTGKNYSKRYFKIRDGAPLYKKEIPIFKSFLSNDSDDGVNFPISGNLASRFDKLATEYTEEHHPFYTATSSSQALLSLRYLLGLTAKVISAKLGISAAMYYKYEEGVVMPEESMSKYIDAFITDPALERHLRDLQDTDRTESQKPKTQIPIPRDTERDMGWHTAAFLERTLNSSASKVWESR